MLHDVTLHNVIGGYQAICSKMGHLILQLAKTTRVSRGERALREKYRRPNRVCMPLRPRAANTAAKRTAHEQRILHPVSFLFSF